MKKFENIITANFLIVGGKRFVVGHKFKWAYRN